MTANVLFVVGKLFQGMNCAPSYDEELACNINKLFFEIMCYLHLFAITQHHLLSAICPHSIEVI